MLRVDWVCWNNIQILIFLNWLWFTNSVSDVAAEKTEKALIEGIEHFQKNKLKHTETQEKNSLPDKEGRLISNKLIDFCMISMWSTTKINQ